MRFVLEGYYKNIQLLKQSYWGNSLESWYVKQMWCSFLLCWSYFLLFLPDVPQTFQHLTNTPLFVNEVIKYIEVIIHLPLLFYLLPVPSQILADEGPSKDHKSTQQHTAPACIRCGISSFNGKKVLSGSEPKVRYHIQQDLFFSVKIWHFQPRIKTGTFFLREVFILRPKGVTGKKCIISLLSWGLFGLIYWLEESHGLFLAFRGIQEDRSLFPCFLEYLTLFNIIIFQIPMNSQSFHCPGVMG